jgi:hypothetical protein
MLFGVEGVSILSRMFVHHFRTHLKVAMGFLPIGKSSE